MGRGIESLERAYGILFTVMLIALAILVMLCLIRAIIGPRVADRIVSVNMTGTMVIVMIAILALMLGEGYLVDICIIYAMISFLAVIVLVKVYMGVYLVGKQEACGQSSAVEKAGEGDGQEPPPDEGADAPAGEKDRDMAGEGPAGQGIGLDENKRKNVNPAEDDGCGDRAEENGRTEMTVGAGESAKEGLI